MNRQAGFIGVDGKSAGGAAFDGTRLNKLYRRDVGDEEIVAELAPLFLAYAKERAHAFARRAEAELEVLPETPARETLRASLTYVLDRRK